MKWFCHSFAKFLGGEIMNNNKRKLRLFLPTGPGGPGFLGEEMSRDSKTAFLTTAKANVLLVLISAREEHAMWPESSAGWIRLRQIADRLSELDPKAYALSPDAVRQHVRRIEREARKLGLIEPLIRRTPVLGYKLTVDIEVVIGQLAKPTPAATSCKA
jgi:hypothetical protein